MMKKTMRITPESGRPSDVAITLPWFAIATVPNAATAMPAVFSAKEVQFTLAICVPRAATRLYRTLSGYSAAMISASR